MNPIEAMMRQLTINEVQKSHREKRKNTFKAIVAYHYKQKMDRGEKIDDRDILSLAHTAVNFKRLVADILDAQTAKIEDTDPVRAADGETFAVRLLMRLGLVSTASNWVTHPAIAPLWDSCKSYRVSPDNQSIVDLTKGLPLVTCRIVGLVDPRSKDNAADVDKYSAYLIDWLGRYGLHISKHANKNEWICDKNWLVTMLCCYLSGPASAMGEFLDGPSMVASSQTLELALGNERFSALKRQFDKIAETHIRDSVWSDRANSFWEAYH